MNKFFPVLIALMLSFAVQARAQKAPDPQIADVEVRIIRHGEPLLNGSALLSWKQNVVFNSLRELPMQIKCKPGYEVTGVKTYWDGIHLELGGITRDGTLHSELGFTVVIPTSEQPSPPTIGCNITFVNAHSYKNASSPILRVGESARIVVDDLTFELTLKHIYDRAPEGRALDAFVVN